MEKGTPLTDKPRAIPFIIFKEDNGFEITPEANKFLASLTCQKLGVISMVGKYRTGKSYFINKVLLNLGAKAGGFAVGPTVNPCTKGLWLWNKTLPASQFGGEPDLELLILDTEGFGGIDEGVNHDTRIFLFSILLSSYFIYNSVGAIDENALQSLAMILNIAKDIKVKAFGQDSEEDIASTFPAFLWVVRDFILSIEDAKGVNMTAKQYLENALAHQKGVSQLTEAKNRTRKYLKQFFPNRDCITLVRPAKNERDLRNLEILADYELRDEFLAEVKTSREKIFKSVRAKMFKGRPITGPLFLEAVHGYTNAINTGKVPNIEQIWSYACQEASRKAFQASLKFLDSLLSAKKLDLLEKGIALDFKKQIQKEVLREFKRHAIGDKKLLEEIKEKLEGAIEERFENFEREFQRGKEKEVHDFLEGRSSAVKSQLLSNVIKTAEEAKQKFEEINLELSKKLENNADSRFNDFALKLAAQKERDVFEILLSKKIRVEQIELQKFEELANELASAKKQIKALESENEELKSNEGLTDQKLKSLAEELEEFKKKLDHSKIESQEKLFQVKQLQNELELRKSREILEAEAISKSLKNELERLSLDHEKEKAELRKEAHLAAQKADLYKHELERKDQHCDSIQRENERLKEEANQLHQKMQRREKQSPKSEEQFKELKENLARSENIAMELKMQKQYLTDQLEFYKLQNEESRRLYEKLILSASSQRSGNDGSAQSDLLAINKTLSASLSKLQSKNKTLEEHIQFLKPFKKILKYSSGVQCQKCASILNPGLFIGHFENCSASQAFEKSAPSLQNIVSAQQRADQSAKQSPSLQVLSPVSVKIDKTIINNEGERPVIQYVLQVSSEERIWQVKRKYKEFCDLYNIVSEENPSIVMPKSCRVIQEFYTNINKILANQKPAIEDRKNSLQAFINDFALIPQVRASKAFKAFLEIEDLPSSGNLHVAERRLSAMLKDPRVLSKELNENKEQVNFKNAQSDNYLPRDFIWNDQTGHQSVSNSEAGEIRDDLGSEIPIPENPIANKGQKKFNSVKNEGNLGFTNKSLHKRLFIN